jgi:benzoylformate decarboxylase
MRSPSGPEADVAREPTVRTATFALLRELGVTTIFGNPGSTELPFLEDFPLDFRYVLALHEAVAVGMADGYAQALGRPALVNLHTAAGLGNAMGAVVNASHNRAPMVVTVGQQDRRHLASRPRLSGSLVELASPYVRWADQPALASDVPASIEQAFHVALHPPCGPTLVAIPMSDWRTPAATRRRPAVVAHQASADPQVLAEIAAALRGRVAIVSGPGVARAEAVDLVERLAERLDADVWADPGVGRLGFPNRHPRFAGFLPASQAALHARLRDYEVVLVAGAPAFEYYPYSPGAREGPGARLLHVTDDPAEAARSEAARVAIGDVRLTLAQILGELAAPPASAARRPDPPPVADPEDQITVDGLLSVLAERLPASTIVVEEAPSSKAAIQRRLALEAPLGYLTTASGGLGFAMPAAVGVKLARPDRRVICIVGDGAAMYSWTAIWNAIRDRAPIGVIVVNDGQYTTLKAFARFLGLEGDVPGLAVGGIDFAGLARGLGCPAECVSRPDELRDALAQLMSTDGAFVLEVVVAGAGDLALFGADPSHPDVRTDDAAGRV